MKNFNHLLFFFLLSLSFNSYSQIGVTGYTNYVLGFNTNKEKSLSFDAKVFTYNYLEDLPVEFSAFYNLKSKEYHRISVGVGLNLSPFGGIDQINAIVLPTSLEIFPIKTLKKIAIVFEFTPEIRVEDEIVIRSLLGVRYTFDKK